ncbi:hypothetical protein CISIN_1g042072mg, partial [Citrus sinensis]
MKASIKLKDPNKIIRRKPMTCTSKDREEFAKQIELLNMSVIKPSLSRHSSPAFFSGKRSCKKKGVKKRMVVNYEDLNKETIDDGYFLLGVA